MQTRCCDATHVGTLQTSWCTVVHCLQEKKPQCGHLPRQGRRGAGVRLLRWKSELPGLVLEMLFLDWGPAMFVVCKYINPSSSQGVGCQRLWWVSCLLTLLSSLTPLIKTRPCLVSVGVVKWIPQRMMQLPTSFYYLFLKPVWQSCQQCSHSNFHADDFQGLYLTWHMVLEESPVAAHKYVLT